MSRRDEAAWSQVPVEGGDLAVATWARAASDGGPAVGPAVGPVGGPVVVAAHGITSSALAWTVVARELAGTASMLAPDLRGRGRSAGIQGPFGIGAHVDDLVAVLDAADVGRALVLGHSMGGFVAALAAARHPDRFTQLVMVDGGVPFANAIPDGVTVDQILEQTIGPALTRLSETFTSRQAYRDQWRAHPALGAADPALVDAYADHDLVGEAPQLRSSCSLAAVRADARSLLDDDEVTGAWRRTPVPAVLLHAERGMLDEPQGLYAPERLTDIRMRRPELDVRAVEDVNHYTITLTERGAGAVATAVRDLIMAP